jgi:hypothetical protein
MPGTQSYVPRNSAAISVAEYVQFNHFDEEVEHIEADKIKAAGFTEVECHEMIASMTKHAKAQGYPFLVVPYMRR